MMQAVLVAAVCSLGGMIYFLHAPVGSSTVGQTSLEVSPANAKMSGTVVNRAHKSHRLDITLVATRKVIPANNKRRSDSFFCEPLASPIVDPILGRLTGRCFARLQAQAFS
jgi:hypothetical protein